MHLVIAPPTFIDLTIIGLEDPLTLTDAFPVFTFVFIATKVECDTKPISAALSEHPLITEPIFEEHVPDTMHLPLGIDLTIVDIGIIDTFSTFNSLNYKEG
jgi:hypothetical protein